MRQRLHLASALMMTPRLLLLDEPTVGLDVLEAARIRDVVRDLSRSGVAILLTSHNPADIELLAERVVVLQAGTVTHDMPVSQFRRRAGFVAQIRLHGAGEPPSADDVCATTDGCRDVEISRDTGEGNWTLTHHVRNWEPKVLADLARTIAHHSIHDIEITSVGVEAVLQSLYKDR
ncbi:hypothetical protein Misp05_44820 [Micromonospora sp. NBRC 107095]|nr:hypothetical protein Misp05_44820 [Micromonospora sp. NBRC 107095]